MARPQQCRRIAMNPGVVYLKPAGIPIRQLEEVVITLDEFEAIRLADLEGLYQEQAALQMNVSRPTFGRILDSAHRKVADALVGGKALRLEGGNVEMSSMREFQCNGCGHRWSMPFGTGRPDGCPACQSPDFTRTDEQRGMRKSGGQGGGGGCGGSRKGGGGQGGGGGKAGRGRQKTGNAG